MGEGIYGQLVNRLFVKVYSLFVVGTIVEMDYEVPFTTLRLYVVDDR